MPDMTAMTPEELDALRRDFLDGRLRLRGTLAKPERGGGTW
jgi:hypothetical protein